MNLRLRLLVPVVVVFILLTATGSYARKSAVLLEPKSIARGFFAIESETAINDDASWVSQGMFGGASDGVISVFIWGTGLGYNYYLADRVLNGPYIGASANVISASIQDYYDSISIFGIAAAGRAGFKFSAGSLIFDVSAALALPLYVSASDGQTTVSATGGTGVGTSLGFGIGYAW